MKANQLARIERLEETAIHWQASNAVYEIFEMDNKIVTPSTWTQKGGRKRGNPIEFETVRAALDWTKAQLTETAQAQIYVDDLRDILGEDERVMFDALYFDAPDYKVMFDIRNGTDVIPEAMRLWRHAYSGIKFDEWRAAVEVRFTEILA